jgi:hypothetical protein
MSDIPHIISLGAGVQSSTMALMAAHGEITPMPIAAVFADTQDEPASVYRWLDWLEKQLPFPVYRVTAGRLSDSILKVKTSVDGRKYSQTSVPIFTRDDNGDKGKIRHRTCTFDYKLTPLLKKARQLAGIKRGQKTVGVVQWIGISMDEIVRIKPSREPWARSRWPLIEKEMRRHHCLQWMEAHGYPKPPRSACVYCPFHADKEWRRLRDEEPEEFQRAVKFERDLQAVKASTDNFRTTPFLHRSLVPLDQVDLSTDVENGQGLLWGNECEGMCGV